MKKKWCHFLVSKFKVKIDTADLERVSQQTWRIRQRDDVDKLSIITSVRTTKGSRNISLGKFIMNPPKGKLVYPRRYFDGFDYRQENLIICTLQERQRMLPKKRKDTSSKYRGVSFAKKKKLWRAGITLDGRMINLGDFKTESEAAEAFNRASSIYFGKNGYQNTINLVKSRRR